MGAWRNSTETQQFNAVGDYNALPAWLNRCLVKSYYFCESIKIGFQIWQVNGIEFPKSNLLLCGYWNIKTKSLDNALTPTPGYSAQIVMIYFYWNLPWCSRLGIAV